MFNKNERTILNQLSKQVFGVESKWQKILKNYNFQIKDGITTKKDSTYTRNKRTGQLTFDKVQDVTRLKTRPMNFTELFAYLVGVLDARVVEKIHSKHPEFLPKLFASRLVKKELAYAFRVSATEEQIQALSSEDLNLPEHVIAAIKQASEARGNMPEFNLDEFTGLVKECLNETSQSNKAIDDEFLALKEKLLKK